MIVVDASIVAPAVLHDEPGWPETIARRIADGPLAAPPHWPVEMVNLLHVAERRGRIDRERRDRAIGELRNLGVAIVAPQPDPSWTGVSALADKHRLTAYDAAYLHLAVTHGATLATLDRPLAAAARVYDLELLTY